MIDVAGIRRLADEIEDLVEPWTRAGSEHVRQMAGKVLDRTRDLQRFIDDLRRERNAR